MRKPRKKWFNEYIDKFKWLVEKSKVNHRINLTLFTEEQKSSIRKYLSTFDAIPPEYELTKVLQVISIYSEYSYVEEYLIAKSTGDVRTSIRLTKGEIALNTYNAKINDARKNQVHPSRLEHWTHKGFSDEDAKYKLAEYHNKKSISLKLSHKSRRVYCDELDNPYCEKFYLYRGFNSEEAKNKIIEMKIRTSCSLESFILRYGIDEGTSKYNQIKIDRKNTIFEKYGRFNGWMPRTSKESIKFLVPIYKFARRLGVRKTDIHWGITGSREFVMNDMANSKIYFYDFVITSLKICVEYHGIIWHPRGDLSLWSSPVIKDVYSKYENDKAKEFCIVNAGYDVITVWSDCDKINAQTEIMEKIKNAINMR